MSEADYLRSFLRDHAAQIRVGVAPHEKHAPQTVIVNVEIEAAGAPRFADPGEESLDRVIDYTEVHRFIATELAQKGHIPLLESVAELIIAFCFRNPRAAKVRVRLEKPGILPGAAGVGVELMRVRKAA